MFDNIIFGWGCGKASLHFTDGTEKCCKPRKGVWQKNSNTYALWYKNPTCKTPSQINTGKYENTLKYIKWTKPIIETLFLNAKL